MHDGPGTNQPEQRQASPSANTILFPSNIHDRLAHRSAGGLARQVFISHTGQDNDALDFATSVLQPALEHAGLTAVVDYKALNLGCDWANKLVDAAANSQVVVVVLSKQFTERFWCMVELDLALHAHEQLEGAGSQRHPYVIPVFYDPHEDVVQPERTLQFWQCPCRKDASGNYGPELSLQDYLDQEEDLGGFSSSDWACCVAPERWARNLQRMRELQNERVGSHAAKDGKLRAAVRVLNECLRQMPAHAAVGQVFGFAGQLESLVQQLDAGKLGVWLHGHGGKGKTKLATQLYNLLAATKAFHYRAMVMIRFGDGGDAAALGDRLREALAALGGGQAAVQGRSYLELATLLQDHVASKRVLYFLDNVVDASQLEHLLPARWGAGSVVIITGRSKPSSAFPITDDLHYHEVGDLVDEAPRQLFRHWLRFDPEDALLILEDELLRLCNRLPLVLELVGRSLAGNHDPDVWQAECDLLRRGSTHDPERKLQGLVINSLAGLGAAATGMFLDTATALSGRPAWLAVAVWRVWHVGADSVFRRLQDCGLLKVDSKGQLAMHDVLMAVGRGLVLDPKSEYHGTRLWVQDGKVLGIPEDAHQQEQTRVLVAQLDAALGKGLQSGLEVKLPHMGCPVESLNWTATRILFAGRVQVPMPSTLLWLEQLSLPKPHCSAAAVPSAAAKSASVACMPEMQALASADCRDLTTLPSFIPAATNLQQLILRDCAQIARPLADLSRLVLLRHLEVTNVPKEVPLDFLAKLVHLEQLDMHGHAQLVTADWLSHLSRLRRLNLSQCPRLLSMSALTHMTALKALNLSGCRQLSALHLGELNTGLEVLKLSDCRQLKPFALHNLAALKVLNLARCRWLSQQRMHHSFTRLIHLRRLDLNSYCKHQAIVLGRLSQLTSLSLMHCGCAKLPWLGGLVALRHLNISYCRSLTALPGSIGQLTLLTSLAAFQTDSLRHLPSTFSRLCSLENLSLTHCSELSQLTVLGRLSGLKALFIRGLHQLVALPATLSALTGLRVLVMVGLPNLVTLPTGFGHLTSLQSLNLYRCPRLHELPVELSQLRCLTHLGISGCTQLQGHVPAALHSMPSLTIEM